MKVKHHYGWVDTGTKSSYEHIRETHTFLTDDNHTYKDTGNSIVVYRNENSPAYHSLTPAWAKWDNIWFTVYYKK